MARRPWDFYPSPRWATKALVKSIGVPTTALECCVGASDIAQPLHDAGVKVVTNDVDPLRLADFHLDATSPLAWAKFPPVDWVITNPAFNVAFAILQLAMKHADVGVAFLLRLSFLEPTQERAIWLSKHPLTKQLVLPRISFTGDGKTDSVTCAWMIWEKGKPPAVVIVVPSETGDDDWLAT